ncbi:MAG: DNA mismatch repair protein MutT [Chitinophaga sp.]|jgi:8-oxo-dGTP diphosphatase|nr:DNA mismatch repair protein MutT [Chitinophaga sp.]
MSKYSKQTRLLTAIDCIVFGFDGVDLKILLVKRGMEPEKGKWSLIGSFLQQDEDLSKAASRILKLLTGLSGVYLEQLHAFSNPKRDPIERTISVAYFALIDIHAYEKQISHEFHAEWFRLDKIPKLIFDHDEMVEMAKEKLQYKAALHPILFELMPEKFTIPQLQNLYEGVYGTEIDKRNFSRKLLSTGLLVKQPDKERENSKKGAYYYKLNKNNYKAKFQAFLNIIPNSHKLKG